MLFVLILRNLDIRRLRFRSPSIRGSAIAERPARRSVSVEMLSSAAQITETDRVFARGTLSETLTLYLAIQHCTRLNYRAMNMRCSMSHIYNAEVSRVCYKQTLSTTNIVDDIAYSSASTPSWMWTTVANKHKFSLVKRLSQRLLDRSKNAILPTHLHLAPPLG